MRHIKVTIRSTAMDTRDILLALLADAGYDGFEEEEAALNAFIPEDRYEERELKEITEPFGVDVSTEAIEPKNWNEIWEAGFEPVVVEGFCTIKAHFHTTETTTPYAIVITPKMSFGTGHHATTQLMMMGMQDMDLEGKSVLDFGTGTGVLAILAEMRGAGSVMAIDNDAWAVENAIENVGRNECVQIEVRQGSLDEIPAKKYDIILANINRHILLYYMTQLYTRVAEHGRLLMSGLLAEDEPIVREAATGAGFGVELVTHRNGWISIACKKI